MSRVLIVQPMVPSYRQDFFHRVVTQLVEDGHQAMVVTGTVTGAHAKRGDATEDLPEWQQQGRGWGRFIGPMYLRYHGSWACQRRADVVICELATGCLDTHLAIARRAVTRMLPGVRSPRVITWGHVGAYTRSHGRLLNAVETAIMRLSDHVLAYTPQGVEDARRRGVPQSSVTSLDNTVDLASLQRAVDDVAGLSAQSAWEELTRGVAPGMPLPPRCAAYVGGLDRSKRIDFLATALQRWWETDPELKVLVGGAGADAHLLDPAVERGQVIRLGRVGDRGKALMSRVAQVMLMPGRVGLVAVESFVLALPIITTDHPFHAPEFDYLVPGADALVLPDDPVQWADGIGAVLNDGPGLEKLRTAAAARAGTPSLEHMVNTFVDTCRVAASVP